jgi:hypothetical protein
MGVLSSAREKRPQKAAGRIAQDAFQKHSVGRADVDGHNHQYLDNSCLAFG